MRAAAIGIFVTGLLGVPVAASGWHSTDDDLSATATVTSDYRFRGESQYGGQAAALLDVDYDSRHGLFADLWVSTPLSPAFRGGEVDPTIGYRQQFNANASGSLSASYYRYRGTQLGNGGYFETTLEYSEAIGLLTLDAEASYSPTYSDSAGNAISPTLGAHVAGDGRLSWLAASAHAGYQWVQDNARFGAPDWFFYDAGLTARKGRFGLDARYVGTNLGTYACFHGSHACSSTVVLSLDVEI